MSTTEAAVKEKPILFSGEMVRAILDGRKTQTRRVIKPQPVSLGNGVWELGDDVFTSDDSMTDHLFHNVYGTKGTPYGAVWGDDRGDRLWVRETWAPAEPGPIEPGSLIAYREDYRDDPHGYDGEKSPEGKYRTWRPSIHMPRWASRINLEITEVRVQRLQEIGEADALAEGVGDIPNPCGFATTDHFACCKLGDELGHPAWDKFRSLWHTIHAADGPNGWDANPWLWCLSFRRV